MKFLIKFFFFLVLIHTSAYGLNNYKYPDKDLDDNICEILLEKLNFPNPPYSIDEPIKIYTDLLIEDIHSINGKDLDFESSFTLWAYWKDERLNQILKELNIFSDKGKPVYLCDYSPKLIIGESRKVFDPVLEFFNRKGKPNFEHGMQDWIEIFSDGTIQSRLRDKSKFKSNFNFRKFPFDSQTLTYELWSEFPSYIVELLPDESAMTEYKENLYKFGDQEEGIIIPGWTLKKVDYYPYSYVEDDGYPYQGFYLNLLVERQSSYYLFKIILPIMFILIISWSVFWVRGSQLEAKVNVTIVCLLSLIAYNFIIDEDLPKLSYLTFLFCFILISYFYTGIATILCVYSFLKKLKSGKDLSNVDKYAQKVGPLSYAFILITLYVYFYNLDGFKALIAGPAFQ